MTWQWVTLILGALLILSATIIINAFIEFQKIKTTTR